MALRKRSSGGRSRSDWLPLEEDSSSAQGTWKRMGGLGLGNYFVKLKEKPFISNCFHMKYHIIRVEIRKRAYGENKKSRAKSDCGTLFDYKYYSNKYGIKLEA